MKQGTESPHHPCPMIFTSDTRKKIASTRTDGNPRPMLNDLPAPELERVAAGSIGASAQCLKVTRRRAYLLQDDEVVTEYEKSLTLSRQGSHCTTCHMRLEFKHLVPVFSFLFLRLGCGFCGAKISRRYPVVELLALRVTSALALSFIGSALLLPDLLMGRTLICEAGN